MKAQTRSLAVHLLEGKETKCSITSYAVAQCDRPSDCTALYASCTTVAAAPYRRWFKAWSCTHSTFEEIHMQNSFLLSSRFPMQSSIKLQDSSDLLITIRWHLVLFSSITNRDIKRGYIPSVWQLDWSWPEQSVKHPTGAQVAQLAEVELYGELHCIAFPMLC